MCLNPRIIIAEMDVGKPGTVVKSLHVNPFRLYYCVIEVVKINITLFDHRNLLLLVLRLLVR